MSKLSEFIKQHIAKTGISSSHPIVDYLNKKTAAVDRDSKSRRSLGNLYALYVLAEDFKNNKKNGSKFTDLLDRMKQKPFGSKLQNHPLDNRLNDEFKRQSGLGDNFLPVISEKNDNNKIRRISLDFLQLSNQKADVTCNFILSVIDNFVEEISKSQSDFISTVESCSTKEDLDNLFEGCVNPKSDARLFEIFSYCVLKRHYEKITCEFSSSDGIKYKGALNLFKTGRTNANDGGIDFVLVPLGKIFQVTETLDFKKYFLDFEKLNRYPITFVIKSELGSEAVLKKIKDNASAELEQSLVNAYIKLFDGIFTTKELREIYQSIINNKTDVEAFKGEILNAFKLEFGHYDSDLE